MPKVSIITPVHNRPDYLKEAVDSIRHQTFTDWEHIIVDDGSTNPATQEVLNEISGLPQLSFHRTENRGLGAARNFGIERSAGQFIVTLDDDDKWHPDFIKTAMEVFQHNPKAGVVTAWMREFGLTNRVVKTKGGDVQNFLIENNSVHGMFKKEYWAAAGGYDEKLTAYEDWEFWLRITALGYTVEVIPQPLFFYRIHHHPSLLKNAREKHLELFRYIIVKNERIYQQYIVESLCKAEEKMINITRANDSDGIIRRLKRMLSGINRES